MDAVKMDREQWIVLFQDIGLDEAAMRKWHDMFERRYPAQHQSFLEWLGLTAENIRSVRKAAEAG